MANIITVLVEHDNINYYKDNLNDIDREIVLKALGEDIAAIYTQYDNNVINVQPNMSDISSTSDSYILGFERSNELVQIAKEWNSELRDNAVRHLEELEALAKISYYNIKMKGELKMITFSKAPFSENTNVSQSSQARDYSYYYDKEYDNLLITFNTSVSTYSDEVHNNIYLIYSEEDDSIVGTQIMYFKKRSLEILKKYLPKFLFEIVEELNTII